MDFEKNTEQSPNAYDDDHDSDLESRLYAEIHFSNNIIGEGEENNANNSEINNTLPSVPQPNLEKTIDISLPSEKSFNQSDQIKTSSVNNVTSNSDTILSSKRNVVIQNDNTGFKTTNTATPLQKRSKTNEDNDLINSNKKQKLNKDSFVLKKKRKDVNQQTDTNKIINPYNKNARNSSERLPLLSPEFINLLFGGSKKRKNSKPITNIVKQNDNNKQKNNKIQQQKKIQETCTSRVVIESEVINTSRPKNDEVQQNTLPDSSTIIDISSDSSEDNSKYNTTIVTDKKINKKKNKTIYSHSEDSSESEESIFEVPVPPKPAPPLIELKDSGSEDDGESDSDSSSNSCIPKETATQNEVDKPLNSTLNINKDRCESDLAINEPDSLILNCTAIQESVSSLSEIKRMSHQSSSLKEQTIQTRNNVQNVVEKVQNNSQNVDLCRIEKSANQDQQLSSSVINNTKVSNTLQNKERSVCHSSKNLSNEEYFFQPMNDKMKSYYNESWGGENFDMNQLKSKMSSDPKKWTILHDDVVSSFVKRRRYFGMVCNRCHKDGHRQNQCTEPIKIPTCHMCGAAGHIEISCPKKMCLTCGKKQNSYRKTCENCQILFCSRCQTRGHMSYQCPDLWRRYHQTINKVNAEPPDNLKCILKSKSELHCCNCAKRGHVSATCTKFRWSQHFPNPEHVTNYNGPSYFQELNPSENYNITNRVDNSINENLMCDSSFYISGPVNNSVNSSSKTSNRSQNFTKSPTNTRIESRKTVIFQIKQKLINEDAVLQTSTLKLAVHDKKDLYYHENWNKLSTFLNCIVTFTPAEFILEQNGKQVQIKLKCLRKCIKPLSQFIKQYASRNNIERCDMLMTSERRVKIVTSDLGEQLNELSKLNENPVDLYKKTKQLGIEVINTENEVADSIEYTYKVRKLASYQRKLLMTLYKEGFLDDSLKTLRSMHNTFRTSKKYIKSSTKTVATDLFFEYLYHYNNVFVPYERKDIDTALQKFQEHIERYNRLKNNPLLFPQIQNRSTNNQLNVDANLNNPTIASEIPSTSGIPPSDYISTANTSQFISGSTPSTPNNSVEKTHHENAEYIKNLKKHPRGLYLESVQSKNIKTKSKLTKKFNHFQEETKKLIDTARELNLSHLHKHIDILQKKMQNEIYIYEKDVKLLKKYVNKALKRRGSKQR